MKKALFLLLAATCLAKAHAADFPVKAAQVPLPAPNPIYNWTGFYVGAVGSYNWANAGFPDPDVHPLDATGLMGGITLGYDYQMGNVVVGVLGDTTFGNVGVTNTNGGTMNESMSEQNFSTIRGRAGYSFGSVLVYGTAGLAIAEVSQGENCPAGAQFGFCNKSRGGQYSLSQSQTFVGGVVGAGVEWMFAPHWTTKVEYLWADMGNQMFNLGKTPSGAATGPRDVSFMQEQVKFGVNYNFGWPH